MEVLDREEPARMTIRYFGSEAQMELTPQDDGGSVLEVTCHCDDPDEWLQFYPGWVSWLLTLKAAADFDVDLRNDSPGRAWKQRIRRSVTSCCGTRRFDVASQGPYGG